MHSRPFVHDLESREESEAAFEQRSASIRSEFLELLREAGVVGHGRIRSPSVSSFEVAIFAKSCQAPYCRLEDDRDRAVVDELDLHHGAEAAGLDPDAAFAELVAVALVEALGLGRFGGGDE